MLKNRYSAKLILFSMLFIGLLSNFELFSANWLSDYFYGEEKPYKKPVEPYNLQPANLNTTVIGSNRMQKIREDAKDLANDWKLLKKQIQEAVTEGDFEKANKLEERLGYIEKMQGPSWLNQHKTIYVDPTKKSKKVKTGKSVSWASDTKE